MRFAHQEAPKSSPRTRSRLLVLLIVAGLGLGLALGLWPMLQAEAATPVVSGSPTLQFSAPGYTVDQSAGAATVDVILAHPIPGRTATVQYAARPIAAASSSDYAAVKGSLTFAPGQIRQAIKVPLETGSPDGAEQVIALVLERAVNATIGNPSVAILTVTGAGATPPQMNASRPTVQFSSSAYTVTESAGTATITVNLINPSSTENVTVTYRTGDLTAEAGPDYTAAAGTLTFLPNQTSLTFTVPIINDIINEPSEVVSLLLDKASANALLGTPTLAFLTIQDDDPVPTVQFSQANYNALENAGTARITVTLSISSEQSILIDYATSEGTAEAGSDYTAVSGTLTFPPGDVSQTFDVPIIDDLIHEHDETARLTLSDPSNATIAGTNPATLTIIDNDPEPKVQFSTASAYSVTESGAEFTIAVTLSLQSEVTATVDYSTTPGTATASVDYTPVTGTLTFTPGVTSQIIHVPIINDALYENDETLNLHLANPSEAVIGSPNPATLTILDDDPIPTLQFSTANVYSVTESGVQFSIAVTLSAPSGLTATVAYSTTPGTATAGGDYAPVNATLTFTPGVTSQVIHVPIIDDALYENDETLSLHLGDPFRAVIGGQNPATLTILNDDPIPTLQFSTASVYSVTESGAEFTIAVTLSAPSELTATVDYNTTPGTATAGVDYTSLNATLTFTPGVTSQVIHVPILNDARYENNETLSLHLANPTRAVIGGPNPATLTILDDDPIPTLQFSTANVYSVTESGAEFSIAVTLSAVSEVTATVDYNTTPGTATAGNDYTSVSAILTFTPGVTSQVIHVPILEDALYENNETLSLFLANPNRTVIGGPNPATLTILDNDAIPTLQFSTANVYSVTESGVQFTIAVTLSALSEVTATVDYNTTPGTATANVDYTSVNGSLTFTPGVTSQVIHVPIINDTLYENNETLSLHLANPNRAVIGGPNPVELTILDDDPLPTLQFSPASVYSVMESGVQFSIAVTLSTPSGLTATVEYSTTPGTATADVDYTPVTGTLTFTPGVTSQVIHVPILNDAVYENDETLSLQLANPFRAVIGGKNPATLTILNDDPPPTAQFERSSYTVGEGDGQVAITITLNTVSDLTAKVGYITSDGTAKAGVNYTATTGTLTFAPGVLKQSFSVPIIQDTSHDPTLTFFVGMQQLQNATTGSPALTTVNILDNNPLTEVSFSQAAYSVNEALGKITLTMDLSNASGVPVGVVLSTQDETAVHPEDYTAIGNQTIVFDAGTTEVTADVTIVRDCDATEGAETFTASLSSPSNATLATPYTTTITISDARCAYLPIIVK